MADKKFYNIEETADVLGVPPAEVNRMREQNELRAFRDGADWKFKVEQVEEKLAELIRARKGQSGGEESGEETGDDVLLSEVELGESDSAPSGTVIGPDKSGKSDIALADSDLKLVGSDVDLAGQGESAAEGGADELDMTLDDDLTLEDSQLALDDGSAKSDEDSGIDLEADALDDDDLVLGGSGSGSDITIGGDSGISLVDPADSGLSLEDPLELSTGDEESLELGEDDMLTLSEEADEDSPTQLKTDDDFLLTPLDEGADEDSESGSQVIALDTDLTGDDAATMVASGGAGMAMLEEEPGFGPELGATTPMPGAEPAGMLPGEPGMGPQAGAFAAPAEALPEAPYTVWNVLSLALCAVVLTLTGMMCYDLLRNMWSWESTYSVNSSIMDAILNLFEG